MRPYSWNRPTHIRRTGYSKNLKYRDYLVNGSVLYSTSDEDSHTEVRGLRISSDDTVFSITGSGCRSLALLANHPKKVVSLDANPIQNYLLEIKCAGMRRLCRQEFLDFIGFDPERRPSRRNTYEIIRDLLSPSAVEFWDESQEAIEFGLLYSGAHERFYACWIAPLIVATRRKEIQKLHSFVDVSEQSEYFSDRWLTPSWKRAVRLLANPYLIRFFLRDPSYFARITDSRTLANQINAKLERTFRYNLASDMDLFGLLCTGRYWDRRNVPFYLRVENYERIRTHLDALEIVTQPLHEYLEDQPTGTYSAFSLSDVSGWMSHDDLIRLLQRVCHSASPAARVVFRDLFSETDLSLVEEQTVLEYKAELSRELTMHDRALVFTVQAFEVVK